MKLLKEFIGSRGNLIWIIFISFTLTFFFTQNSPFYKYDTWADSSVYAQVGHSWLTQGMIPYKEIFDHKGPLHFLLFGIGTLLRYKDSFIGVYIIEGILLSITNYFYFKTSNLFINNKKISLLIVTIIQLLLFSTINFNIHQEYMTRNVLLFERGGSPEEFCLPYISIIMYFVCLFFKNKKIDFSSKQWILIGLSVSAMFLEKFTVSIPFIILLMITSIYLLTKNKSQLLKQLIYGWGTLILTLVVIIIYFKMHGALSDFITYYFKVNIINYSEGQNISIIKKVFLGITVGLSMLKTNILLLTLFIGGTFVFIFTNKIRSIDKIIIISLLIMSYVINMLPGRGYTHYLLPLMPIILISIILVYNENWNIYILDNFQFKLPFIFIVTLVITIGTANEQMNFSRFNFENRETQMEQMAKVIKSDPKYNPKKTNLLVLNSNFVMLHTLTNTTPKTRFFYAPAMRIKQYNKEITDQLKNAKPDYIYMNAGFSNEDFRKSPMKLFFKYIDAKDRKKYKKYFKKYNIVHFSQDTNKFTLLNYFMFKKK